MFLLLYETCTSLTHFIPLVQFFYFLTCLYIYFYPSFFFLYINHFLILFKKPLYIAFMVKLYENFILFIPMYICEYIFFFHIYIIFLYFDVIVNNGLFLGFLSTFLSCEKSIKKMDAHHPFHFFVSLAYASRKKAHKAFIYAFLTLFFNGVIG